MTLQHGSRWSRLLVGLLLLTLESGMLTRPTGHEAKAAAEARKSEDEAEAQNFFRGRRHNVWGWLPRPMPNTLENKSVCMSMKTKILAFRT